MPSQSSRSTASTRAMTSRASSPGSRAGGRGGWVPSRLTGRHLATTDWPRLLVRGFVGGYDAVWDAAAITNRVAAGTGPFPDVRSALTAWHPPGSAPTAAGQNPPGVRGERADLLAEFLAVRRAQVNLIRVSVHGK